MTDKKYLDLYIRYLGVLTLLGKISSFVKDPEDRELIEQAIKDCCDSHVNIFYTELRDGSFDVHVSETDEGVK